MSGPTQFLKLTIPAGARARAEAQMDQIEPAWREKRPVAWAGLAAEEALCVAATVRMKPAQTLSHDLEISTQDHDRFDLRVEVKTRAVDEGWTDPRRFEWLTIPTHDGREPVKDVDLVFFCWFSGSEPDQLWALGYLLGKREFLHRSMRYEERDPLPRGGWAPKGGAYCLEVSSLRPFPRGMFQEKQ